MRKAINDWEDAELDATMLHACNAVDGTAAKAHSQFGSAARFTALLRDGYPVLGPMGAPGIDLIETRFPVEVASPKASDGLPDIADLIYGIHRCHHGHGDALSTGFDLIPDASGPPQATRMIAEQGRVQLSDRIIFGLLAIAVFHPINVDQRVSDSYFLVFADQNLPINEWWGRADDFQRLVALNPMPLVKLDFGDWMENLK